jgi:enterochelin esterase-like enzyme
VSERRARCLRPRFLSALSLAVAGAAGLVGCTHTPAGRLNYVEVASRSEGQNMRYGVYEPPGWDHRKPLPLVVLLHGAGDDETAADRPVVTGLLDRAIVEGRLPPFLMVTPDGDRGLWMDWYDGSHHFRSWVLDEVVAAIRKSHPIIAGPAGLHLVGASMGGGGGIQMWLAEPARFASATIISAPILGDADTRAFLKPYMDPDIMERVFGPPGSGHGIDPFARLTSRSSLAGSRLIFGAAEHDLGAMAESNAAFHEHLVKAGVPHRFVRFAGFHRWKSWAPMIEFSLCHQLQDQCPLPDPEGWVVETVDGNERLNPS